MARIVKAFAIALLSLAAAPFAAAEVHLKSDTINGMTVRYKVVTPPNYDPAKAYPAVLAFPPGPQTMDMVDATLFQNFRDEAEKRGYIVIEPAAPGMTFIRGGDRIFPAFIEKMLTDYKIQNNKFHAAGNSNGGRAAFLVASKYPQHFWSVTGFPGLLEEGTPQQMANLAKMCIHMFVGEHDPQWIEAMRGQTAAFQAAGTKFTYVVERGESHVIRGLEYEGATRLYDQFDAARKGACAK